MGFSHLSFEIEERIQKSPLHGVGLARPQCHGARSVGRSEPGSFCRVARLHANFLRSPFLVVCVARILLLDILFLKFEFICTSQLSKFVNRIFHFINKN